MAITIKSSTNEKAQRGGRCDVVVARGAFYHIVSIPLVGVIRPTV